MIEIGWGKLQNDAHKWLKFCYNRNRQYKTLRSTHRFGSGETWKILLREPAKWRMRPYGRVFFRGFSQGIPGSHRNRGRGFRPLSFAVNGTRAKGKNGNRNVRKAGSGRTAQKPRSARGRKTRRLLRTEGRARSGKHARRRWPSTSLPN